AAGDPRLRTEVKAALSIDRATRSAVQTKPIRDYYLRHVYGETRETFEPLEKELAAARKQIKDIEDAIPHTLVTEEMAEPRPAYVLFRGDFLQKGEKVTPSTPAFLPPLPAGASSNRLGLARWLVGPDNPLTARVAVNRLWAQTFGEGIVRTLGDFGTQGDPPSHPELLDWLAGEVGDSGGGVTTR